jgi:hypothetical protein
MVEKFGDLLMISCPAFFQCMNSLGHSTTNVNGQKKEADKTYGPMPNVPNSIRDQRLQASERSITIVVEVGRTQQWQSLRARAFEWYHYHGIEYILLISINADASRMSYEFYDVSLNPLLTNEAGEEFLPNIKMQRCQYSARCSENGTSPQNITFDCRRLLGIPTNQPRPPLPNGVPNDVTLNLRLVLDNVWHAQQLWLAQQQAEDE